MTAEHHPSLDWLQVQGAVGVARGRFKELKARYRELSPYLVFSSRLGQIEIDAAPAAILGGFAAMVDDDARKSESMRLIADCEALKRRREQEAAGRARSRTACEARTPSAASHAAASSAVRVGGAPPLRLLFGASPTGEAASITEATRGSDT